MSSPKTAEGLQKLVALSLILQNMPDRVLVEDKLSILRIKHNGKYLVAKQGE